MRPTVLTCGHSNRTIDELIALLRKHGATRYVDIRRWPVSRRHPQFSRERLAAALEAAEIPYVHEEALGGHREPRPDSVNAALRKDFLRGYADHLATPEAMDAVARTLAAARAEEAHGGRLVIACAEKSPADCHRQVLADALVAAGARVLHAVDLGALVPHVSPATARFEQGAVTYPASSPSQATLFDGRDEGQAP